ncbi:MULTISPECIES: hypothetical protein [unclassified Frankia]|uniref:hypothetical protein n=1 Tax=Frankia sp. CcI49 TaxID=1745382 RepID=UPI000975C593
MLDDQRLTCLKEIMRALRVDFDVELVGFNGERDHVRLPVVPRPPKVACRRSPVEAGQQHQGRLVPADTSGGQAGPVPSSARSAATSSSARCTP